MQTCHSTVLILLLLSSCSLAGNCGDCEMNNSRLANIEFVNSNNSLDRSIDPPATLANTSITSCGLPDLNNTVFAYATDQFGHTIGPNVANRKVNFTYFADLDIRKVPHLITDMDVVGPNLALVEYNITVTNIGQVNVTDIQVFDSRLGNFSLANLGAGQNATITPNPYYIITPDEVNYCWIDNIALSSGTDRYCKSVGPVVAYANFPLGAKNLEIYLNKYSYSFSPLAMTSEGMEMYISSRTLRKRFVFRPTD